MADAARRTTSRHSLTRQPGFDEVSPEVGELDEVAFDELMREDPDAALALLASLSGATDEKLRNLAGRVVVDVVRSGAPRRRGIGRLRHQRADRSDGELDLDRGVETLAIARAHGEAPSLEELHAREWSKPALALCLLIDRSGSMNGERLAAAAVAAAACLWRAPIDTSVVAFSEESVVIAAQGSGRETEQVIDALLRLRGHGPTDLALGLRTAREQLERSTATRRITILLSDARPTMGGDPAVAAGALDELVILAPAGDSADAEELAGSIGARCVSIAGPSSIPQAIAEVLAG